MRRNSRRSRRAAATVELALCLPLLATLVLGSIEACSMIFMAQSLHISVYEGARTSVRSGGTVAIGISRAEQLLEDRYVYGFQITTEPQDVSSAEVGSHVTFTATAPCSENSIMPVEWFYGGRSLSASCTMVKE